MHEVFEFPFVFLELRLVGFKNLRSALSVDVKTKDLGLVEVHFRGKDDGLRICLNENVWERSPKVGPVNIDISLLGKVYFFAFGAKNFHSACPEVIAHANWQDLLPITECPWAVAERAIQVLLVHLGESGRAHHEPCVDQSVKVRCQLVLL